MDTKLITQLLLVIVTSLVSTAQEQNINPQQELGKEPAQPEVTTEAGNDAKRNAFADFELKVDEVVSALLQCREVVSLSLAVVHDNTTVLTKAYGPANLESGVNSTESTLFNVASMSKAFAATLLGVVLEETGGRFNWTTRVRDILGDDFRFATEDLTEHATLRDLLSHRLGTPTHNDVRLRDDFSRAKAAEYETSALFI